jgi:hypothetical protein
MPRRSSGSSRSAGGAEVERLDVADEKPQGLRGFDVG